MRVCGCAQRPRGDQEEESDGARLECRGSANGVISGYSVDVVIGNRSNPTANAGASSASCAIGRHESGGIAQDQETLGAIITHVLVHEIGHHFGLSDDDMMQIEAGAT